jgi:hypothetical protein
MDRKTFRRGESAVANTAERAAAWHRRRRTFLSAKTASFASTFGQHSVDNHVQGKRSADAEA